MPDPMVTGDGIFLLERTFGSGATSGETRSAVAQSRIAIAKPHSKRSKRSPLIER
jgi:hypothetical protein